MCLPHLGGIAFDELSTKFYRTHVGLRIVINLEGYRSRDTGRVRKKEGKRVSCNE
jgi:hypothetical protein